MLNASMKSLKHELSAISESPYFHAIKAEFEAEGTRFEELAILNTLCTDLNISLTLKIGGPLAQRDIIEALQLGASSILVPMVESGYIAKSSIEQFERLNASFGSLNRPSRIYMNIETITAVKNCEEIIEATSISGSKPLKVLVIGRSDLAASLDCTDAEEEKITSMAYNVIQTSKAHSIKTALGGNITQRSLENIRFLHSHGLNYYETRKCTFELPSDLDECCFVESINRALTFELSWLRFKNEFYQDRATQDNQRIAKILKRMELLRND